MTIISGGSLCSAKKVEFPQLELTIFMAYDLKISFVCQTLLNQMNKAGFRSILTPAGTNCFCNPK